MAGSPPDKNSMTGSGGFMRGPKSFHGRASSKSHGIRDDEKLSSKYRY